MRFGDRPDDTAANSRREVIDGLRQGAFFAAVALSALFIFSGGRFWRSAPPATVPARAAAAPAAATPQVAGAVTTDNALADPGRRLDLGKVRAPQDVTRVAAWAVREGDNGTHPFAIVDKRRARVYVFAPSGRLIGTSPVLLGYAAGDLSVAGIGTKPIDQIKPQERTTPAGRFQSAPGRNALGDDVVWVDYGAAVSMHRVRATNPKERRLERLATPTPADNRISWGCINVPVAFFDKTVWPNLGRRGAVVYVLPERQPLTAFFPDAGPPQYFAQASPGRGNNAKP